MSVTPNVYKSEQIVLGVASVSVCRLVAVEAYNMLHVFSIYSDILLPLLRYNEINFGLRVCVTTIVT